MDDLCTSSGDVFIARLVGKISALTFGPANFVLQDFHRETEPLTKKRPSQAHQPADCNVNKRHCRAASVEHFSTGHCRRRKLCGSPCMSSSSTCATPPSANRSLTNMQSEGRLKSSAADQGVLSLGEKGLAKAGLVHTVSIVVEPVEPSDNSHEDDTSDPYVCKTPTPAEEDMVRSLIMNAELRKEEFAKLLEEHAQIVMEINKAENSLA